MHLYFHADFDGLACAALLEDFFLARGQTVAGRHALHAQRRQGWRDERLQRPAAVADFRHHPDADWWFDHHRSSCAGAPGGERMYCDPDRPSCARLVFEILAQHWDHAAPNFAELAAAADRIDGTNFDDPLALVHCASPWLRLSLAVQTAADLALVEHAAGRLARQPQAPENVLEQEDGLRRAVDEALRRQDSQLDRLRREGETLWGGTFFVYPCIDYAFHKHLPFVAAPAACLGLGLVSDRGHFEVVLSKNRWNPDPRLSELDVAALCRKLGGGGHVDRGGVPAVDLETATALRDSLLCELTLSLQSLQ